MNTALEGQDSDMNFSFLIPLSDKIKYIENYKKTHKTKNPSIKLEKTQNVDNPFDDHYAILDHVPTYFSSSIQSISSSHSPSSESKSVKEKKNKRSLHTPFTKAWLIQRVVKDKEQQSIPLLRSWVHAKRRDEINSDLVQHLKELDPEMALQAIDDLTRPRQYIRGGKGQQLDVPVILSSLKGDIQVRAKALIDSGCTGSCINEDFVNKHGLETYQTPIAISVYNADNTRNSAGSIKELVKV